MRRHLNAILLGLGAILLLVPGMSAAAQPAQEEDALSEVERIRTIRERPDAFLNEVVTLEGFVTQYVDDEAQSTDFYYLKDDFGALIKVRTSREAPEVGERYRISGPVGIDPDLNDPFVSEESRASADAGLGESVAEEEGRSSSAEASEVAGGGGATVDNLLLIAIAVVFVLLVGVLVWVIRSQRRSTSATSPGMAASDMSPASSPSASFASGNGQPPEPDEILEDKTVKMHAPPPGTLKILPGRLRVLAGLDEIENILLYRANGQGEETEITIGRANGKPYQHIQLKPRTVSSKQAKLVYTNNGFTLINYASEESNPTQVNGKPMSVNESVQLDDGDRIRMGEVEFMFSEN